ncbi:hypothetical protein HELRODRAFT_190733 [Helobdella robusta]|uniref:TASOR pseudo-PARP domain-containing protein n=1 Tax=Helobdella robusta TaxID=6412 RepID=T1FS90_HELRO|nr:hypothetical protein HELRODRAFT_190733 [Helobdella robusta]ESO09159.1 hypothetical protein HELRODRAFT_190733 [Helobdella robusta]
MKDLMRIINLSYKDKESHKNFVYTRPRIVINSELTSKFVDKKKRMRTSGYSEKELQETFGFLFFEDDLKAVKACREGLQSNNSSLTCLGDPKLGVYLSRHADVLSAKPMKNKSSGSLLVVKMMKGRAKLMADRSNILLEPSPNFDCHMLKASSIDANVTSHADLFECTQLYMYEYTEDSDLSTSPAHLLPYAVVNIRCERTSKMEVLAHSSNKHKSGKRSSLQAPQTTKKESPIKKSRTHAKDIVDSLNKALTVNVPLPTSHNSPNLLLPTLPPKDQQIWSGSFYVSGVSLGPTILQSSCPLLDTSLLGWEVRIEEKVSVVYLRTRVLPGVGKLDDKREQVYGGRSFLCGILHPNTTCNAEFNLFVEHLLETEMVAYLLLPDCTELFIVPSFFIREHGLVHQNAAHKIHLCCLFVSKSSIAGNFQRFTALKFSSKLTDSGNTNQPPNMDTAGYLTFMEAPASPEPDAEQVPNIRDPRIRFKSKSVNPDLLPTPKSQNQDKHVIGTSRLLSIFENMAELQDKKNDENLRKITLENNKSLQLKPAMPPQKHINTKINRQDPRLNRLEKQNVAPIHSLDKPEQFPQITPALNASNSVSFVVHQPESIPVPLISTPQPVTLAPTPTASLPTQISMPLPIISQSLPIISPPATTMFHLSSVSIPPSSTSIPSSFVSIPLVLSPSSSAQLLLSSLSSTSTTITAPSVKTIETNLCNQSNKILSEIKVMPTDISSKISSEIKVMPTNASSKISSDVTVTSTDPSNKILSEISTTAIGPSKKILSEISATATDPPSKILSEISATATDPSSKILSDIKVMPTDPSSKILSEVSVMPIDPLKIISSEVSVITTAKEVAVSSPTSSLTTSILPSSKLSETITSAMADPKVAQLLEELKNKNIIGLGATLNLPIFNASPSNDLSKLEPENQPSTNTNENNNDSNLDSSNITDSRLGTNPMIGPAQHFSPRIAPLHNPLPPQWIDPRHSSHDQPGPRFDHGDHYDTGNNFNDQFRPNFSGRFRGPKVPFPPSNDFQPRHRMNSPRDSNYQEPRKRFGSFLPDPKTFQKSYQDNHQFQQQHYHQQHQSQHQQHQPQQHPKQHQQHQPQHMHQQHQPQHQLQQHQPQYQQYQPQHQPNQYQQHQPQQRQPQHHQPQQHQPQRQPQRSFGSGKIDPRLNRTRFSNHPNQNNNSFNSNDNRNN